MFSAPHARRTALILIALLGSALAPTACSQQRTPSQPTQTPATRPNIAITVTTVKGETRATGYAYRAVVQLRESAGAAATIVSVDLAYLSGTTVLASSHHDQPISGSNVVPASGTAVTAE